MDFFYPLRQSNVITVAVVAIRLHYTAQEQDTHRDTDDDRGKVEEFTFESEGEKGNRVVFLVKTNTHTHTHTQLTVFPGLYTCDL